LLLGQTHDSVETWLSWRGTVVEIE
jgi:hypothetical protein